jgi:hypothetical protein
MTVKQRRPVRIAVAFGLVTILAAAIVWILGFFWWRMTLSRTNRQLRSYVDELKASQRDLPPERQMHFLDFYIAGSRAVPFLLSSIDEAIGRGDSTMASESMKYLSNAVYFAETPEAREVDLSPNITLAPANPTLDQLRLAHRENSRWWRENQSGFAPWWKWWDGKRRRK